MAKKYKIKKFGVDIEPHEVFLDTIAHAKEDELGVTKKKFEVPLKNQTSYVIFGFFLLIALVLFSKVFYFQYVNGKILYTEAENNKGAANLILPPRGIIYDKNLKPLVLNSPAYDLLCSRANFSVSSDENVQEIATIANLFNLQPGDIINTIQSTNTSEALVTSDISQQNLLVLESEINNLPGCTISQNTERDYVTGPVLSQVLGYTGRITQDEYASSGGYSINDNIGQTGLEKTYESYLRGTPGQSKAVTSATGVKKTAQVVTQPTPGDNLVLNIDSGLQAVLYNSLAAKLKAIGSTRGAAVAMNPQTGAVLAIVSYPSYDDNEFAQGITSAQYQAIANDPNHPLFDRAISAQYPTGSIIKPLEASAALQEKTISPDKLINDPGYILVPSENDPSVVYRYGGVEAHGLVDMRKAIAVSSNIYFYTVGGGYDGQEGLGPDRIKKYLTLFGWDNKTGIDLPGEFAGFIPSPAWKKSVRGQSWYIGDTYNLSIGQSDLETTPLQVADAYSAIANGGTLYQPQVVNKIISGSGSDAAVVKQFTPQVTRSGFIDPANLEIVREGMRDGVDKPYGLSNVLNNLPVEVAAKTGTAQIPTPGRYNLWSAAFAPYNDPQIVIVVTAEAVDALGAVTLPVAHDGLSYYFSSADVGIPADAKITGSDDSTNP